MTPSISIIVPAFNEASRLGASLRTICEYLNQYGNSELILVDDGSADQTAAVAEEVLGHRGKVSTRLIRYTPNRGKGYAVRAGLLASRAPIALFTDADLSTLSQKCRSWWNRSRAANVTSRLVPGHLIARLSACVSLLCAKQVGGCSTWWFGWRLGCRSGIRSAVSKHSA